MSVFIKVESLANPTHFWKQHQHSCQHIQPKIGFGKRLSFMLGILEA